MATKIYVKTGAVYRSVVFRIEGKNGSRLVEFGGGMLNLSRPNCFLVTSDEELQNDLEANALFNAPDGFELLESEEVKTPDSTGKVKEVNEVKNFNAAKEYILKNYKDYTQADVSSTEKLRTLADTLGLSFPNWA
jgi:hypothetical protein